jgi:hypothetical protein
MEPDFSSESFIQACRRAQVDTVQKLWFGFSPTRRKELMKALASDRIHPRILAMFKLDYVRFPDLFQYSFPESELEWPSAPDFDPNGPGDKTKTPMKLSPEWLNIQPWSLSVPQYDLNKISSEWFKERMRLRMVLVAYDKTYRLPHFFIRLYKNECQPGSDCYKEARNCQRNFSKTVLPSHLTWDYRAKRFLKESLYIIAPFFGQVPRPSPLLPAVAFLIELHERAEEEPLQASSSTNRWIFREHGREMAVKLPQSNTLSPHTPPQKNLTIGQVNEASLTPVQKFANSEGTLSGRAAERSPSLRFMPNQWMPIPTVPLPSEYPPSRAIPSEPRMNHPPESTNFMNTTRATNAVTLLYSTSNTLTKTDFNFVNGPSQLSRTSGTNTSAALYLGSGPKDVSPGVMSRTTHINPSFGGPIPSDSLQLQQDLVSTSLIPNSIVTQLNTAQSLEVTSETRVEGPDGSSVHSPYTDSEDQLFPLDDVPTIWIPNGILVEQSSPPIVSYEERLPRTKRKRSEDEEPVQPSKHKGP